MPEGFSTHIPVQPTPETEARRNDERLLELHRIITQQHEMAATIDSTIDSIQVHDWVQVHGLLVSLVTARKELIDLAAAEVLIKPLSKEVARAQLGLYTDINEIVQNLTTLICRAYRAASADLSVDTRLTHTASNEVGEAFTNASELMMNITKYTDLGIDVAHYVFAEQPDTVLTNHNYMLEADCDTRGKMITHILGRLLPDNPDNKIKHDTRLKGAKTLAALLSESRERYTETNISQIIDVTEAFKQFFGPEIGDVISAWLTTTEPDKGDFVEYFNTCLHNFFYSWEKFGKEATLGLIRNYGIRHFHHASSLALRAQATHKKSNVRKFGIIVLPYSDHNNGLKRMQPIGDKAYQDIHATHDVVYIEVKHRYDLLRKLSFVRKEYGNEVNNGKAEFLALCGHGEKNSLQLGSDMHTKISGHELNSDAIIEHDASKTEALADNVLSPNAPVLLISCSTGIAGGIANTAANFFNRTITAPDVPTNITGLTFARDETGSITTITPIFDHDTAAKTYTPNNTQL